MHDQGGDGLREIENLECFLKEPLVHSIIGLLQVQLENHIAFLFLGFSHMMHNRLKKDGITRRTPPWDETALEWAYHILQKRSQPVDQDLSDKLIQNITQAYRSEVLETQGVVYFGDEDHKIVGDRGTELPVHKAITNKLPEYLVKDRLEPIGVERLI